jgi:ABC-type Fe3+-citrate transport system substrate-binding protein
LNGSKKIDQVINKKTKMGKRAKEHRKKVAKRNANLKVQEKVMQKLWQEAFDEQMSLLKEKFAAMSGETMSGLTSLLEDETEVQNEELQEGHEPTEHIQ